MVDGNDDAKGTAPWGDEFALAGADAGIQGNAQRPNGLRVSREEPQAQPRKVTGF